MKAIKLFQGYLWHPKDMEFNPKDSLPKTLGEVHVLVDALGRAPFAFFEDGTPTEGQRFYQVTLLVRTTKELAELKPLTEQTSRELAPHLNATPEGVGWLILEDLRPA